MKIHTTEADRMLKFLEIFRKEMDSNPGRISKEYTLAVAQKCYVEGFDAASVYYGRNPGDH